MARVFWALQMLVTPERVKTKMDESEDDETLNVKSERFNPLHALYSESRMKGGSEVLDLIPDIKKKKGNVEPSKPSTSKGHVSDVQSTVREIKPPRNLYTQISEMTKGPLTVLKKCMENRIRVKVRKASSLYCNIRESNSQPRTTAMVTTIIAIIAFETTGEVVNSKKKKMNIYKSRRKKARVRRAAAIFAKQLRSLAEEEVEDEEEDRLGCL
ncbi:hypothetical protein RUM43_010602 [Polyplax serrata]|uniref:Uncharacterized protein n=1 Tax=Polyplax serrata TaxID=468196 RepID=A0AAN8P4G8_POLSC